jgi:hypothetical protein
MGTRDIRPLICYQELDNCTFAPTGLEALAKRFFTTPPARVVVPYEEMLLFEYDGGLDVRLLDQIPPEYQQAGVSYNYRPYQRITSYVPFPRRPQIAFEFTPDSARLAPADWRNTAQTIDDRRACGVSSLGRCSLLFYGDSIATTFEQDLPISGKAGEKLELTLWNKARDTAATSIPIASVTVFYSDGTTEIFTASTQPSADWTLTSLAFQPAKPYTHLLIELLPNLPTGLIWLDDLHLTRDNLEIPILNPSFEQPAP